MRKAILIFACLTCLSPPAYAQRKPKKPDPYDDLIRTVLSEQAKTLAIGNVELRLGMTQETVMRLLSKYRVTVQGAQSFTVLDDNSETKQFLGSIGFENSQLNFISRSLETSAWPRDEGFSAGRAIYDALNAAIERTDSDGAKRTKATIIISNRDLVDGMNLRTISMVVESRKIIILIADSPKGKSISAQIEIQSKPW